ncbi:MAG TPA: TldD/PmbA family protein [Actinomycetota bacterium]|nr:TldD/PmbA family protein [Actinomycetota bacterium]
MTPRGIGDDRALGLVEAALRVDGADEVEATLVSEVGGLTRFADSVIHQHTERADAQLKVRVVTSRRSATVSTNQLTPESIRDAGRRALEMASLSPPDAAYPGLPSDGGAPLPDADEVASRYDGETAEATPRWRGERVREVVDAAGGRPAAGFFSTQANECALANTNGIRRYGRLTVAAFTGMVRSDDGSAHHEEAAPRASAIPVGEVAERLAADADRARGATDIDPGTYPVVLLPLAVAEMVQYLAYVGFGARDVLNEESFLVDWAGRPCAAPVVTIADDVGDPASLGPAFDWEGVWRQRVAVIDGGVATGPVYDTRTAAEAGTVTTGHSTGSREYGPFPANLVVGAGDSAVEELIGGIDRGLLVPRFWYVNVVNARETVLTGMTRDGLFRIEDGKVAGPVHNLRFTQNVLEALRACSGVGRETLVQSSGWDSVVAPALRLDRFTFTSGTSH